MDERQKNMDRREFFAFVPPAAAVLAATPAVLTAAPDSKAELTAGEVHRYLKALDDGWVKWEDTVDTFKSGGPQEPVRGIAVGWMSYSSALAKAVEMDCNLFVTHEPTYYNHRDNDETIFRFEPARAKRKFIEDNRLTIIRCHDVWDQFPKVGIPTAWGSAIGLPGPIDGSGYYYVYDGEGRTAAEVARRIAGKVAEVGQPGVQLIGDRQRKVGRVVVGCGAITPMFHFIEKLAADMAVCSDDGFTYWRDGAFAIDTGFPVAVVNHPVTEEYGVIQLARQIAEKFPAVPVHHIPQRCMYELVTA
ncbi:MAG: Nif3-like dinuclear metal center hexameric protein [Candidatus Glassbacteria bacterium]